MHDSMGSSSGGLRHRRNIKNGKQPITSASRAVREGYVADSEKPPPPGIPSKRASKRIPTSVQALIDGKWKRMPADLSAGGALLLFANKIEAPSIELQIELADGSGRWTVTGSILRREQRGTRFAHHLRFEDAAQVEGLGAAIEKALAEDGPNARLDTK